MARGRPLTEPLEPIERASRDELESAQLRRLTWSVRHAYDQVAPYRAKCLACGAHPDDLRSLADLARFPFTTKQDLRDAYPFGFFAVPREQVVRVHASSGTTGKPTVVGYTARDIDTWAALMARSIRAAGGRRGDIVHVAYGYGLFTGGLGCHYGAERLGCTVVPTSGGQTEKQVQLIVDFRPDVIMVTPSYLMNIAEAFEREGVDPRTTSLSLGIFGAEPWSEAMRTEFPSQIEELIVRHAHLAPHYLLEVRRDGSLDELTVRVEPDPRVADQPALRDQAARDLGHQIKSYIGISAAISVCDPGTIERSAGKAKRVIDARR